mmetsp:Transcript_3801/g.13103  ORF Transcript_3801/g.13103 Transcript_3801/m.13103 type:complete len:180 (+) Transcript_3801:519-1058(+)
MMAQPNAGGSSEVSEVLSMEVLSRLLGPGGGSGKRDVVGEMEVTYWSSNWKKVDYLCRLPRRKGFVGVSVTRAMGFPTAEHFGREDAERLLHKKLHGLVVARQGLCEAHAVETAILHVWCQTQEVADLVEAAARRLQLEEGEEGALLDGVTVVLTVAGRGLEGVFTEDLSLLPEAAVAA